PSTSEHTSPLAVASARIDTIVEVRPEERGPKISVIAPRGSPPVSVSSEAIPVGTLSKTRRSRSVKGDGTRSPRADSNRARRITDCISNDRDNSVIPNMRTVVNDAYYIVFSGRPVTASIGLREGVHMKNGRCLTRRSLLQGAGAAIAAAILPARAGLAGGPGPVM